MNRSRIDSSSAGERGFRSDVEGLRAIAVLLVVAYHARIPGVGGGFIGVDVFFVISGFLMTRLLLREIDRTGRVDVIAFWARRARRLLPASALVVLATLVVGHLLLSPLEHELLTGSGRAAALYVSNVWFILRDADYFADVENNPLLHTWSLAVEEQFYVLWPLLLWFGRRRGTSRARVGIVVGLVSAASLVTCVWLTSERQPWAFYSLPTRVWEFGVGGFTSLASGWAARRDPALLRMAGWLGGAAIVGAGAWIAPDDPFPGWRAAIPVSATACVILAGTASRAQGIGRLLELSPLQIAGRLSYSWYLWHWPLLAIARMLWPALPLWASVGLASTSLAMSSLTYRWIERPVRFSRALVSSKLLTFGLAILITATAFSVATTVRSIARHEASTDAQRAYADAARTRSKVYDQGCVATDEWIVECTFGRADARTTVVLIGDSHAAQWFAALEQVTVDRGWRLVTLIKSACPAPVVPVFNPRLKRDDSECALWRHAALERIRRLRPAAVVIASSIVYVQGPGRTGGFARLSADQWRAGMRQLFTALADAGSKVIVLRDSPHPGFNVPICLSRTLNAAACIAPSSVALDERVFMAERQAAAGNPRVTLVDLSAAFCTASACPPIIDGIVVYLDNTHITSAYARALASRLGERLDESLRVGATPSAPR